MNQLDNWIETAWEQVVTKVERNSKRIGASFPHVSLNGKYDCERPEWWTAGFWPGMLWLIYREVKDENLSNIAISCEEQLDEPLYDFYELGHDIGFMWSLTSVARYKICNSEESKRRALTAASHLAGRFNIKGSFIRSWNDGNDFSKQGWVIVDSLMNLPLLYWASETINDPRFRHIAAAHADMVLKYIIREDGSVPHVICFDPETGERVEDVPVQAFSNESAWSRGAAWAIYGLALSSRYTGEKKYLDAAKKVTHFFLANLEEDMIPYWDFRAPDELKTAKDTSAAACAASGLIEISRLVGELEKDFYYNAAIKITKSLYEKYCNWEPDEEGIVANATGNFKRNKNVNRPIIYGDYFFIETLAKLRGSLELFW